MRFIISAALLLIFTASCSKPQPSETEPQANLPPNASASIAAPTVAQNALSQVVSVGDGDTIRVRRVQEIITVRLACIDAPETAQAPWGQQSTQRLRQLLPQGLSVQLREVDIDKYKRTVAEIYLGNQSVNIKMVKDGQAVVYRQYLNACADTQDQYLLSDAQAKAHSLGFWNQENPTMPWDYRRGKRKDTQPSSEASQYPKPQSTTANSTTPLASPLHGRTIDPNSTAAPVTGEPRALYVPTQGEGCMCPYDITQSGRRCGEASAYSNPGGEEPICYVGEKSARQLWS